MKRSDFKNKRKNTLKKVSKQKISTIQNKIWALLRLQVFKKYGTDCYTCPAKRLSGVNLQCGHMWAKASLGAYLKYDMRVLRPQCFRCNINFGGAGAVFYARMLSEIGTKKMNELELARNIVIKAYPFYVAVLADLEA